MSFILSTLIFASATAAQITTSIWLPSYSSDTESYDFQASVVGADGDQVTLAIEIGDYDYYERSRETITFHGSTAFENVITTALSNGEYTLSYGCSKKGNNPVCVYSSNGPAAWSDYCSDYTDYTDVATSTEPYDYRGEFPEFCSTGTLLPESYAINTVSAESNELQTYAITITAGENKLSATAGATPTNSGASATTTSTGSVTPTGSPSGGNSTVPTSSPTAPAEQTGAAAPMATLAPALAGLGALIAALF